MVNSWCIGDRCPCANDLECTQTERSEEFYRQMYEAMHENRPVVFLTGGLCPAYASDCMKLREHKEKQLKKQR